MFIHRCKTPASTSLSFFPWRPNELILSGLKDVEAKHWVARLLAFCEWGANRSAGTAMSIIIAGSDADAGAGIGVDVDGWTRDMSGANQDLFYLNYAKVDSNVWFAMKNKSYSNITPGVKSQNER